MRRSPFGIGALCVQAPMRKKRAEGQQSGTGVGKQNVLNQFGSVCKPQGVRSVLKEV